MTDAVRKWPDHHGGMAGLRRDYAGQRGRLLRHTPGVVLVGVLDTALDRLQLAQALQQAMSAAAAPVTPVVAVLLGPIAWLVDFA